MCITDAVAPKNPAEDIKYEEIGMRSGKHMRKVRTKTTINYELGDAVCETKHDGHYSDSKRTNNDNGTTTKSICEIKVYENR